MNKKLIITIIILSLLSLLLLFGKNKKLNNLNKNRGHESIASISLKIEENVLERLHENLKEFGFEKTPEKLILLGLKEERLLEVYAETPNGFKLLKTYPFTAFSGKLGPKLQEGDKQIPEGIYSIEYLNPNSSYYLSMKVNYPNKFDLSKTTFRNNAELGGDIFIHGKSVTIGCIPIGDLAIEELFILVKNAIHHNIKVIISPRDFRQNNNYPKIDGIDWEDELYRTIERELKKLKNDQE